VAVKVYHNKPSPSKTTQYSPYFSNNETRPSNTHYHCSNITKFMCVFPSENASTYSNKNPLLINILFVSNIGDKTKSASINLESSICFRGYLNSFDG